MTYPSVLLTALFAVQLGLAAAPTSGFPVSNQDPYMIATPTLPPSWHSIHDLETGWAKQGQEAIRRGQVAVILLAGGHGSRLGSSEPKGCFAISPVRRASLFQLFAERVGAVQQFYQAQVPVVVWVSHDNAAATRAFWERHGCWGLQPEFVVQPDLPLLDEDLTVLTDAAGLPIPAPNGNGSLWGALAEQGVLERWSQQGIKAIAVTPVDNPLANPLDPAQIGAVTSGFCQTLLLTGQRQSPTEAVGVVLHDEGRIAEYSELPEKAQGEAGCALYPEGFLGMTTWSLDQARACSTSQLPIHIARKTVILDGQKRQAWKQELFIFDHLTGRAGCATRLVERDLYFAPLKSAEGDYGIAATQRAMARAAQTRAAQLGLPLHDIVQELSAELWVLDTQDWQLGADGWAEAASCPCMPMNRSDLEDEVGRREQPR